MHHEIKAGSTGNSLAQDRTFFLTASAGKKTAALVGLDASAAQFIRQYELRVSDSLEDHDYSMLPDPSKMTEYKKACIVHIAGYVVKMTERETYCRNA